jgi:Phospholipase_D-nuclease N-terminal
VGGVVMLAYSYPILGVFWSMLIFFGFFVVIWVVIWCFVDDFRRSDHSGLAKAGWAVLIIFLPLIGSLIYMIARPAQV